MESVFFLVLRRMRTPLLLLICSYAIAIGGLVLMPGMDDQGRPWKFDFLHAFYFISYTASTIGFGEIPYPFSAAQRLWTTFSIYLTVLAWLYAFGNILALIQDPRFQHALAQRRFMRGIKRQTGPFFMVCGFGETGAMAVALLGSRGLGAAVIDHDPAAITTLELEPELGHVPGLLGDARDPSRLALAGLNHPSCRGVIAVTGNDETNVEVTLAAMLLRPGLKLVCQARLESSRGKLPSTHSAMVIDPFLTFATALALAVHQPATYRLYGILGNLPGALPPPIVIPPRGRWILCGHGRFGRALETPLRGEGISLTIIDTNPAALARGDVVGVATDADVLEAADLRRASGIIAGTDSDITNLGILINARAVNPSIFTVLRQNEDINHPLVAAAQPDLLMEKSRIVIRQLAIDLTTPLLRQFLLYAIEESAVWASALSESLLALSGGLAPEIFASEITETAAPAVFERLRAGEDCHLGSLYAAPGERGDPLACIPLLLLKGEVPHLLPGAEMTLETGDRVLFAAGLDAPRRLEARLFDAELLHYLETGEQLSHHPLFRRPPRRQTG
jgi:voltage-gated potassium channel Kch